MVPNSRQDWDVREIFPKSCSHHLDHVEVGVLRLEPDIMGRQVTYDTHIMGTAYVIYM